MPNTARMVRVLLPAAVLLSACGDGGTEPDPKLFDRYVAVGNSITAGYESDGINDSTQAHSYAVLLAQKANASFQTARLQKPGCPPPLTGPMVLTQARVGGASVTTCAGFVSPIPQPVQNLSFPGFRIGDALQVPTGILGAIYQQAFGNRSLIQAMIDAKPTLVTVWLGNNDALTAVTTGDLQFLTSLEQFQASLSQIVSALQTQTSIRDAVLIGVLDPQFAPITQPGAYFWAVAQDPATKALLSKPVSDNCAPLSPTGQLNPLATNQVSFRILVDASAAAISCADNAPYVLNAAERQTISARVSVFNAALRSSAEARGWIYLDANQLLQAQLADPNRIRKCQALASATTLAQFQAAILSTCPHPGAPNFFGSLISFDAVHPTVEGQRIIADAIEAKLREKHGQL